MKRAVPSVFVLVIALFGAAGLHGGRENPARLRLFKDSRAHLAHALANDRPHVTLVIAAAPGRIESFAKRTSAAAGRVVVRDDDLGYLRVEVPAEAAAELAENGDVEAAAVSITGHNFLPNSDQRASDVQTDADLHQGDAWLRTHRFRPQQDLGIDRLWQAHPEFDGRGVTVAILDGFVDLLLPEFARSKTADGETVRKVADQVNVTDPRDGTDPHWVDMRHRVEADDSGLTTFGDLSLRLPAAGGWRVGRLDERAFETNAYLRGDLDRDGNPQGRAREFVVAWHEETKRVWVDANKNLDLRDDPGLQEYHVAGEVGVLGRDRPETPQRESVSFTVTIAEEAEAVSINLGFASHGTEIAGALAASRSEDGLIEGIAPEARIVNFWHGATTHGLIEGAIRAFRDQRVDMVVVQQNVFLLMDYARDDGGSVVAVLLDRLVERYRKPAFAPASNVPGPGQLSDVGLGRLVFAVGAYESRASWWTFAGLRVAGEDNVSTTGSWGPGGAGQMKPDFLAPARAVTPNPGFLPGGRVADLYALPPGRAVCGGTSCATPQAAGVAACLLSASRQTGLNLDVHTLGWALAAAARPTSLPAHGSGAGLIQADAAWELLRSRVRPPRIHVSGDVRTALSPWLETPDVGRGTFLREEPARKFRVRIRRLDGPPTPVRAGLRWRQQDAPFGTVDSIVLPLNEEVPLEVEVLRRDPGVHSAVLELSDPRTRIPWHLSLHAVVIPLEPATAAEKLTRATSVIDRPGLTTIPVLVPEGTSALRLRAEATSALRMYVVPPDRRIEPVFLPAQPSVEHALAHPAAGTWLVTLSGGAPTRDRTRAQAEASTEATFTAALYRVEVEQSSSSTFSVINSGAPFVGGARASALLRRRVERWQARPGVLRRVDLEVPPGAEWLDVRVEGADGGDADLYLFDCTDGGCGMLRAAMSGRAREERFVANPAPGRWCAIVDPLRSSGLVRVVVDIADPTLGGTMTGDPRAPRQPGERWTVEATTVRRSMPGAADASVRLPLVARDLEVPSWTAPAGERGGTISFTPSWFPLAWIEVAGAGHRPDSH